MAKIIYFSIETKVSLNNVLSEIFEILAIDNQMVTSCGQDEHHISTKKLYFSCVIGIYFMSFFYEHPVLTITGNTSLLMIASTMVTYRTMPYSTF